MPSAMYRGSDLAWLLRSLNFCRDDDEWDTSPLPHASTIAASGQRGGGSFAGNPHLMLSARGNGLDLRPATASGILTSEPSSASSRHDAHATRETDLGSLSAQLFAPRPQVSDAHVQNHAFRLLIHTFAEANLIEVAGIYLYSMCCLYTACCSQ